MITSYDHDYGFVILTMNRWINELNITVVVILVVIIWIIIRNDDGDEDNKEEGEGIRGEGEERREGREGEGMEHCIYQTINDIIK